MVNVGACFVRRYEQGRYYEKRVHQAEEHVLGCSFSLFFSGPVLCVKVLAQGKRMRIMGAHDCADASTVPGAFWWPSVRIRGGVHHGVTLYRSGDRSERMVRGHSPQQRQRVSML